MGHRDQLAIGATFEHFMSSKYDRHGLSGELRCFDPSTRAKTLIDRRTKLPFSFSNYADDFDRHIERSIRGYNNLIEDCVELSQYFVENRTVFCDIGCATGRTLAAVRARNHERAPDASYVGLDIEPSFQRHWPEFSDPNTRFLVRDVLTFEDFAELSMVTSIFTLQFLPERNRRQVCRKIYEGLISGGAFIVAEKTFAKIPKTQDMLTSLYLNYKRQYFSDAEVLDKEKALRDMLKPVHEADLMRLLTDVGFKAESIESFWRNHLFAAYICIKQ
jgi:tRNA (cmo5U34)-methyltransferase